MSSADPICSPADSSAGGIIRRDDAHTSPLGRAIDRARQCLLSKQHGDGHWCGELQGDTILESEYILLMAFLGREREDKPTKAARYLLSQQMPDGGWNNYPGGPVCLSTTVKAYFALKLTGHDPDAPYMRKAREVILAQGGAIHCNSFTRFYLALLGQIPYSCCPAVPPEMIFLPRWFYVNIYAMSSWTRTIVVPLSICYAHKPVRRLPVELGIAELFAKPPQKVKRILQPSKRPFTWHNFFLAVNAVLNLLDPRSSDFPGSEDRQVRSWLPGLVRRPLAWLRATAVQRAMKWMIERFADSDGLGAIFPPMIYTVISLRCLGYAHDSPEMRWALGQIDDLMIEDPPHPSPFPPLGERGQGAGIRLQPCFSPVWDTGLAINALGMAGADGEEESVRRAVDWLLQREVRRKGDWSLLVPDIEPGGWFFEYRNSFYPDTDDTAMVLMALARTGHAWISKRHPSPPPGGGTVSPQLISPVKRALNWLLAMQNSDGGWAAFDRNINREVLTKIPFADHNAMLDPSCPDITARVLEALGQFGYRVGDAQVDRAMRFIARTQDRRGCWIGRWGVNYIYGTWQVLQGLEAVQFDMRDPMIRKAVAWLKGVQQSEGGWGESCRSYDDPQLAGQGEPTASQTAWALLGLIAAGEAGSAEVEAGIDYLIRTQQPDGNWQEEQFTGTGFPKVFYLKYHYYSLYFPLMALGRFHAATDREPPGLSRRDKPAGSRRIPCVSPSA